MLAGLFLESGLFLGELVLVVFMLAGLLSWRQLCLLVHFQRAFAAIEAILER